MASVAALGATMVVPATGYADPGDPEGTQRPAGQPTIAEVQERLDGIERRAEIAAESLNTVREQTSLSQQRLRSLRKDLRRQRARVAHLRDAVVGSAVQDYGQGGGLSDSTTFFAASDPSAFVDSLAAEAVVEDQAANQLTDLTLQQRRLDLREQEAGVELRLIAAKKRQAAKLSRQLAARKTETKDVLDRLEEERRQRILAQQRRERREAAREARRAAAAAAAENRQEREDASDEANDDASEEGTSDTSDDTQSTNEPTTSDAPASSGGSTAVDVALDQVGDAYVWGASGPSSFDCSGLMLYAWDAAGVSLPHSSSMQASVGTPISSTSELQPGDLVFYYSPISHVGMYIGDGQIVHAANPSSGVTVAGVDDMPIAAMTRVG